MQIHLKIDGMTCGGCKAAVERVLTGQPGVTGVTVNLASGAAVASASDGVSAETLIAAVEDAGYEARVVG